MEKDKQIHIRVSETEKMIMENNMKRLGFRQLSEYLRFMGLLKPTHHIETIDNGDGTLSAGKAWINLESCDGNWDE